MTWSFYSRHCFITHTHIFLYMWNKYDCSASSFLHPMSFLEFIWSACSIYLPIVFTVSFHFSQLYSLWVFHFSPFLFLLSYLCVLVFANHMCFFSSLTLFYSLWSRIYLLHPLPFMSEILRNGLWMRGMKSLSSI